MLLSVIVIFYNSVEKLPLLLGDLEHILSNQFARRNMEVLLVDDGSTDGSDVLCEQFTSCSDGRKLIRQNNQGPSAARNTGLKSARGQYVTFFDSDDRVDSMAFARLLAQLSESAEADVWCSDFYRVDRSMRLVDKVFQIENTDTPIVTSNYLTIFLGARDCYWNVWRYVFRRAFLLNNELLFLEGYHCAEDLEYMTRCFLTGGRCAFFHNPYYLYVVEEPSSLTHRYTAERMEHTAQMLERSARLIQSAKYKQGAEQMGVKIVHEYIMNLPLLYEVPRGERRVAKESLSRLVWLQMIIGNRQYRLFFVAIRLFGISTVSMLLYGLRHAWRLLRRMRRAGKNRAEVLTVG